MPRADLRSARLASALVLVAGVTPGLALAQHCDTVRVSVSSTGGQGQRYSSLPSISANGRYVAFQSASSNLVPSDLNERDDIFVRDRAMGQTTLVSVSSTGVQGISDSDGPAISADGRFVAFSSPASNLVAGDTNGANDIFVHDRQTGATTRVSVSSAGLQADLISLGPPSISDDGRYVSFHSLAHNLVSNDTNGEWDVFVHDRLTGQTSRVSVSTGGGQGNEGSTKAAISGDGRLVAFESLANDLVLGDTNGSSDVFVHDRATGQTTRVSVDSGGNEGNGMSGWGSVSINSRHVAFTSWASNLVPDDTNGMLDVFVRDLFAGETTRVSVDSDGGQATDGSGYPSLSADGQHIAFGSSASNLVPGDTNLWTDVFVHQLYCPTGTPYCSGDGSGEPCPCGNVGAPGTGCANSGGSGAALTAIGSPSVSDDDLGFDATQLPAGQPALLFAGLNAIQGGDGALLGDGLRCAGGSVVRLGTEVPGAGGAAVWGPGLGAAGGWSAGEVRRFQVWYRDPSSSGACGFGFNSTNGVEVTSGA